MARLVLVLGFLWMLSTQSSARADTVRVAVAANFAGTLTKLIPIFSAKTGHRVVASSGSSGQLFAQVLAKAPFDVFLSADLSRPTDLIRQGHADKDSLFVYARGQLILWSPQPGLISRTLKDPQPLWAGMVAIAEPRTAPYGALAQSFLQEQGAFERLKSAKHLVVGTSITHTLQFVQSGAAPVGFVARSQVQAPDGSIPGSWFPVPDPTGKLDQAAVLLKDAKTSEAARAFLTFLRDDPNARAIIQTAGYGLPSHPPHAPSPRAAEDEP